MSTSVDSTDIGHNGSHFETETDAHLASEVEHTEDASNFRIGGSVTEDSADAPQETDQSKNEGTPEVESICSCTCRSCSDRRAARDDAGVEVSSTCDQFLGAEGAAVLIWFSFSLIVKAEPISATSPMTGSADK
jgi:hypothetical protein